MIEPLALGHGSSSLRRRERLPAEQIEEITKRLYSDGLERLIQRLEGPCWIYLMFNIYIYIYIYLFIYLFVYIYIHLYIYITQNMYRYGYMCLSGFQQLQLNVLEFSLKAEAKHTEWHSPGFSSSIPVTQGSRSNRKSRQ